MAKTAPKTAGAAAVKKEQKSRAKPAVSRSRAKKAAKTSSKLVRASPVDGETVASPKAKAGKLVRQASQAAKSAPSKSSPKDKAIKAPGRGTPTRAKHRKGNAHSPTSANRKNKKLIEAKSIMVTTKKPTPRKTPKRALKPVKLAAGYRPSDDEPFMNRKQQEYFRRKLLNWKEEILKRNRETVHILYEASAQQPDIADRATSETDRALELRARERQRKLVAKIDAALGRIADGSYGYCEDTGEPIGLKRLDARPIATLSLEAQERHERRERVFRDD